MDDRKTTLAACAALAVIALGSLGADFTGLGASGGELSTADRLRMLYATQLTFTSEGDPIIRLGLMHQQDAIAFTPSAPIHVLPGGDDGPIIELPAEVTYTVSASDKVPGVYKHWVVAARLPVAQRGRAEEIKNQWAERGYTVERFEVGGLFAVKGKVFDSRLILFAVGGQESLKEAETMQRSLQDTYGIEGGIHSELITYPSATLTLSGAGIKARVIHRDLLQIQAADGDEAAIRFEVPKIQKSYGKGTETRTYTSALIFAPDRDGSLVLINSLGAERALRGVVPAEIYASAPQAALQAQSIAARNEIFSAIGVRNLADPFMLRADVYDQVYKGVGAEDKRTDEAIKATRGRVMFYGDQIVEAFYSSNAGGFTEDNENVWDMEARPYLRGRADAPTEEVPEAFRDGISEDELDAFLKSGFEAYSKSASVSSAKLFRWEKSVEIGAARAWLKKAGLDVGTITGFEVVSRGTSGRVKRLEVVGSKGRVMVERELNVRRLFGGLRSGLFVMTQQKNSRGQVTSVSFKGAGFGHGVGMCQTGAIGMAEHDLEADAILKHYYTDIEIRSLY